MTHLLYMILIAFWLVPTNGIAQSQNNRKQVLIIDPGHGGSDSGASGTNGVAEKKITLQIAKKIVSLNSELFGNSYEIYLTRYGDTLISLTDRTRMAKTLNADVFLSLHCNHSGNPNAKGAEVYVATKGKYIRESIYLAHRLQEGLVQNIGYKSRGVKFANFQVLRETIDYCPTVLLELGFLSNLDESYHLTEEEHILAIALSILSGLGIKN